jgi:hypothetical protein
MGGQLGVQENPPGREFQVQIEVLFVSILIGDRNTASELSTGKTCGEGNVGKLGLLQVGNLHTIRGFKSDTVSIQIFSLSED